ncbi:MAG: hypothetical protein ABUK18_07195, partial [Candidatus Bathyarchaeia archaeon]
MNSKKAITILVIATLLMAFVPVFPANADLTVLFFEDKDGDPVVDGDKGDTVVVLGEDGNVPGGSLIELFWDDATIAWNGIKGKLNETTADGDGNFEIWFKIPESKNGDHTVWIQAGTDYVSIVLPVYVKVDPASDSGLENDRIDVDVFGQSKEKDIGMVLVSAPWTWMAAATETVALDLLETEFDDTLPSAVGEFVEPGSVMVTVGVLTYTDNGDGDWDDPIFADSSINYVTGEWELEFDTAPDSVFTIDYNEFVEDEVTTFLLSSGGTTNVVGSYMKRIVVPDPIAPGAYDIETLDAKGV